MANACNSATSVATMEAYPQGTVIVADIDIKWDTGGSFDCKLIVEKLFGASGVGTVIWTDQPSGETFAESGNNTGVLIDCDASGGTHGQFVLRAAHDGALGGTPNAANNLLLQCMIRA